MLSGCLYTDVDNIWTNPILKLVAVVTNYKNNTVPSQDIDLPIITYTNNSHLISLND